MYLKKTEDYKNEEYFPDCPPMYYLTFVLVVLTINW
jgi:hypothetical protein